MLKYSLFFLFVWPISIHSQLQDVACLGSLSYRDLDNSNVFGDVVLYNNVSSVKTFDLNIGENNVIETNVPSQQYLKFNDQGGFFTRYEEDGAIDKHRIYFVEPDGSVFASEIIFQDTPELSSTIGIVDRIISGNLFYVSSYDGLSEEYTIWESDGTQAGTEVIFSSWQPIRKMYDSNGVLLFAVENFYHFDFYQKQQGQDAVLYFSMPLTEMENIGSFLNFHEEFV